MRTLVLVPLLGACWSTTNKDLERKVDALAGELASNRADVQTLQRKVTDLESERDRNTELQDKLERLEQKLAATAPVVTPPVPPPPPPRRFGLDPTKTYAVAATGGHTDGPADAKVTIVLFDEYQCPYCERIRPTMVDLRKKYGKDLRVVYRQFVVHPATATAAALAICAAAKQKKQDKLDPILWDKGFHQRQYDQRTQLPDGSYEECWTTNAGCPVVSGFAKEAGLDVTRFQRDMRGACVAELAENMREATALGVSGTPATFVNGRHLSGAQPIQNFEQLIDEEARKADERIRRGTRRARYYQEWVIDRGDKTP